MKQSGFTLESNENATITASDGIMGIVRIPPATSNEIYSIQTTNVDFKASIKEQGYAQLIGIPVRFLNARGESLLVSKDNPSVGDVSADGELMFTIECDTYNPAKNNART